MIVHCLTVFMLWHNFDLTSLLFYSLCHIIVYQDITNKALDVVGDDGGNMFARFNVSTPMDRQKGSLHINSTFVMPQRMFYPDFLPPSRGSYMDPPTGGSRPAPFSSVRYRHAINDQFNLTLFAILQGRLSSAPYQMPADINLLNDVMKISQKKLQTRTDRPVYVMTSLRIYFYIQPKSVL